MDGVSATGDGEDENEPTNRGSPSHHYSALRIYTYAGKREENEHGHCKGSVAILWASLVSDRTRSNPSEADRLPNGAMPLDTLVLGKNVETSSP